MLIIYSSKRDPNQYEENSCVLFRLVRVFIPHYVKVVFLLFLCVSKRSREISSSTSPKMILYTTVIIGYSIKLEFLL